MRFGEVQTLELNKASDLGGDSPDQLIVVIGRPAGQQGKKVRPLLVFERTLAQPDQLPHHGLAQASDLFRNLSFLDIKGSFH